jgi:hypothetical protein
MASRQGPSIKVEGPHEAQNRGYLAPFGMNRARNHFRGGRSLHLYSPHTSGSESREEEPAPHPQDARMEQREPETQLEQGNEVDQTPIIGTLNTGVGERESVEGEVVTTTVAHLPTVDISQPGQVALHHNQDQLALVSHDHTQGQWQLVTHKRGLSPPRPGSMASREREPSRCIVPGRSYDNQEECWPPPPSQRTLSHQRISNSPDDVEEPSGPDLNYTLPEDLEQELVSEDGVQHPAPPPAKVPRGSQQSPSVQRRFNSFGTTEEGIGNSALIPYPFLRSYT